jgi:hypothetical protein
VKKESLTTPIRIDPHELGLMADVEKAFHHIKLHESDRDYLRWWWLSNPEDPESPLIIQTILTVHFEFGHQDSFSKK